MSSKWKVGCKTDSLVPTSLAIWPSHLPTVRYLLYGACHAKYIFEALQMPHACFLACNCCKNIHVLLTYWKSKVVQTCGVCNILTWRFASRHSCVHFWTAQLPKVLQGWELFVWHVHFHMCFAPQARALFDLSSARWLRPVALASLLFDPSQPPKHWKDSVSWLRFTQRYFLNTGSLIWLFPDLLLHLPMCRKFDF